MRDIWEVLLQTLTVSVIGIYLLIVKTIFRDKLPPRWQFYVWGILLLGLIIPASGPGLISMLTETLKTITSGEFTLSRPVCFFPLLNGIREINIYSIIFIIYFSGVIICAVKYLFSYIRLRLLIGKCPDASADNKEAVKEVSAEFSLPVCEAVTLKGVSSPFVCGIFKPVLVLPEHTVDKKIIMHELLHLKYKDIVFGTIICIFRCIHWFNPLLQCILNRINNDIEELCDARVIEKLEGEEIREYGNLLLSMANEKYASVPGTSSAANGGKNIQSRIETLVRHKTYPKNSSFISVCISVILAICLLLPGTTVFPEQIKAKGALQAELLISAVRSYGCNTPAAALDVYGKAVTYDNAFLRALCAPLEEHSELYNILEYSRKENGKLSWDTGLDASPTDRDAFQIYNFISNGDGSYEALIVIQIPSIDCEEENNERFAVRQIHIYKEDGRWVVMPLSDFRYITTYKMLDQWGCEDLPGIKYTAVTENFIIEYNYQLTFRIEENASSTSDISLSAHFSEAYINTYASLTYIGPEEKKADITAVGLATETYSRDKEFPEFKSTVTGNFSSSSSSKDYFSSLVNRESLYNVMIFSGGGRSTDPDKTKEKIPECIAAGIYINGELTDTVILERSE